MPRKPVTIRRWEVVAAFIAVVALAAASVQISFLYVNDRVDDAEKRITQNAVRNAAQDEVRRQLVAGFRAADMRSCQQIEVVKKILRPEPFDELESRALLADIGIDPASERGERLLARGRADTARERRELAPREC